MNINLKRPIRKKGGRFNTANKSGMNKDRAGYIDIEQKVKQEVDDY